MGWGGGGIAWDVERRKLSVGSAGMHVYACTFDLT